MGVEVTCCDLCDVPTSEWRDCRKDTTQ